MPTTIVDHLSRRFVIITVLVTMCALQSKSEDWPKYRRDLLNTDYSAETGISSANVSSLKLKWRFPAGGSCNRNTSSRDDCREEYGVFWHLAWRLLCLECGYGYSNMEVFHSGLGADAVLRKYTQRMRDHVVGCRYEWNRLLWVPQRFSVRTKRNHGRGSLEGPTRRPNSGI